MVALPILAWLIIERKRDNLNDPDVRSKISNMYIGVHLYRDRYNKYFYPIFLLRRLLFVAIPSLAYNFPFIQL